MTTPTANRHDIEFVRSPWIEPTAISDRAGPVRVVFVGGSEIIAEGIRAMMLRHPERAELVGHVRSTDDPLGVAAQLGTDVVLLEDYLLSTLDLDLGKLPFRVVVFTDDTDERSVMDALRRGASGYILKSLNGAQLVDHLARVRDGEVVIDPIVATQLAVRAAHEGNGYTWPGRQLGLSQRESQVLTLLADGRSNRLIASELLLAEETIKTHLRNIYKKLEVRDRGQAVATAIRHGIAN
jgi:DNA-binding NarL/FixJ family response regulator